MTNHPQWWVTASWQPSLWASKESKISDSGNFRRAHMFLVRTKKRQGATKMTMPYTSRDHDQRTISILCSFFRSQTPFLILLEVEVRRSIGIAGCHSLTDLPTEHSNAFKNVSRQIYQWKMSQQVNFENIRNTKGTGPLSSIEISILIIVSWRGGSRQIFFKGSTFLVEF